MDIQKIDIRVEGITPLIIHNVNMANPLNEWNQKIKEISGKRKKTEADLLALQKLEFQGGLYYDNSLGPYLPSQYFEAAIAPSLYSLKRINKKTTRASLFADEAKIKLLYDGPRDIETLWKAGKFHRIDMVKVMSARVLRCRPCFQTPWAAEFSITIIPTMLNPGDVKEALIYAGHIEGVGDWRPKFGRFNVVKFDVCKASKAA